MSVPIPPFINTHVPTGDAMSEGYASSVLRINAARHRDYSLFRNNVGVLLDKRGVPVRYGLANTSKEQNAALKSGDFIGWRRIIITPEMVGCVIAQFVSAETKRLDWAVNMNDSHTAAQAAWANLVNRDGGCAFFTTGDLPK